MRTLSSLGRILSSVVNLIALLSLILLIPKSASANPISTNLVGPVTFTINANAVYTGVYPTLIPGLMFTVTYSIPSSASANGPYSVQIVGGTLYHEHNPSTPVNQITGFVVSAIGTESFAITPPYTTTYTFVNSNTPLGVTGFGTGAYLFETTVIVTDKNGHVYTSNLGVQAKIFQKYTCGGGGVPQVQGSIRLKAKDDLVSCRSDRH